MKIAMNRRGLVLPAVRVPVAIPGNLICDQYLYETLNASLLRLWSECFAADERYRAGGGANFARVAQKYPVHDAAAGASDAWRP